FCVSQRANPLARRGASSRGLTEPRLEIAQLVDPVDVPALLPGRHRPLDEIDVTEIRQIEPRGDGEFVARDGSRIDLDQAIGVVANVVLELRACDSDVAQRLQEPPRE